MCRQPGSQSHWPVARLSREIPRGWGIASFSSLIAAKSREVELPDRDSLWGRKDEEAQPLLPHAAHSDISGVSAWASGGHSAA